VTIRGVARRLHVSASRVRQLDAELRPERCACGSRVYSAETVEAFAAKRAAAAAELARVRSARMAERRAQRRAYQERRREQRRREREHWQ